MEKVRSTRAKYLDRISNSNAAFENFIDHVVGEKIATMQLSADYVMDGFIV